MTRTDLQQLSELRLGEAQLLLSGGSPSGAYYLAGYAVECALKAYIAKATVAESFPDRQRVTDAHTHDLAKLLRLAGLNKQLESSPNDSLATAWELTLKWSEASRYMIWKQDQAEALVTAIKGEVILWLAQHW